jgi:DNA-binding transcriptional ArsR family regulator
MLPHLSGAEVKIMLYLFRKTLGYQKRQDRLSLKQIASGTRRRGGEVIDEGTGLSRSTVAVALKSLAEKGLIQVQRALTEAGDSDMNVYSVRWESKEVVRKSDHPNPETGPQGSPKSRPPTDVTKIQLAKMQLALAALASDFLRRIGYAKPSKAKRERTLRVLAQLIDNDGYTLDETQAACEVAASLGARGPELIPHVIGKATALQSETDVGERLAEAQQQARRQWEIQTARFDALSDLEREALIERARTSNPIIASRPPNHPLVRAAAIALVKG